MKIQAGILLIILMRILWLGGTSKAAHFMTTHAKIICIFSMNSAIWIKENNVLMTAVREPLVKLIFCPIFLWMTADFISLMII